MFAAVDGTGIDDVADIPRADGIEDLFASLTDLMANTGTDPVFFEKFGRPGCGFNVEAHVIEPPHQRQRLFPILPCDRDKDCTIVLQLHAGCLQRLVHGAAQLVVVSDGLTGGLHLRGEVGIQALDLVPGEYRNLHIMALPLLGIKVKNPLFLQALSENHFGRDICERIPRGLREEGHRPGGPGVDFDDIHVLVTVHNELDVVQPDDPDPETQLFGILEDDPLDTVGDRERRIHADRIAGVHPGTLYQLHDPGHKHVAPVTDRIDLDLLALDVLIHQHGLVGVDFDSGFQIMPQHVLARDDLHGAPAQNKARTHQHRVADLGRGSDPVLDVRHRAAPGLGNVEVQQDFFEAVPVLRSFDGGTVGPDDPHTAVHQGLGEIDGGLAAQRGNDTFRLLKIENCHHVFRCQRLKIQLVPGGVIGRNGLGVVVDDDGLIICPLDGLHRVHGGIVKLYPLPNADRPRAQHDDLLLAGQPAVVLPTVRGVEVSDVFPGVQRVHHPEHRRDAELLPAGIDLCFLQMPGLRDPPVRKAHLLGF